MENREDSEGHRQKRNVRCDDDKSQRACSGNYL